MCKTNSHCADGSVCSKLSNGLGVCTYSCFGHEPMLNETTLFV